MRRSRGLVLVVVLMVLVVLTAMTTALSLYIQHAKRRVNYMIDYQRARYACDSALKYVLSVMPEQQYRVTSREGLPDFSDLFWLSQEDYAAYLQAWLDVADEEKLQQVLDLSGLTEEESEPQQTDLSLAEILSAFVRRMTDPNASEETPAEEEPKPIDPLKLVVPGPYGPPWPLVSKPIELTFGEAKVTVEIEDENAKMPLGWAVSANKAAKAALTTFCEWMSMTPEEIEELHKQCALIQEQKTFVIDPQPILIKSRTAAAAQQAAAPAPGSTTFRTTRRLPGQPAQPNAQPTQNQPAQSTDVLRPAIAHAADFGKLFHSSLLDLEDLTRSRIDTGLRNEAPLRYLALWGSQEVNINTAPRQVLEAAFMMVAEKPEELAKAVIEQRQSKPFSTLRELEELVPEETSNLRSAAPYLTTQSVFFQIRIVSRCGNARCAAAATVFKDQKKVELLAVLYGR
ncbi:MAG TPA: type II secretion system protein GspK [Anaerohalosphaeraceae bacterium]|nr:type II secretion system protein GspK [Anaerohalosphaeraceae bacterium]HOL88208.1 type II secretion system protein GspK [Anaerohalosphaeraceae bacterium]HPP56067.1 type II secretion system protein GspK [Anaerohalosphaeraceae bacterium]